MQPLPLGCPDPPPCASASQLRIEEVGEEKASLRHRVLPLSPEELLRVGWREPTMGAPEPRASRARPPPPPGDGDVEVLDGEALEVLKSRSLTSPRVLARRLELGQPLSFHELEHEHGLAVFAAEPGVAVDEVGRRGRAPRPPPPPCRSLGGRRS
uniref:Uncharacterized protein n=1 Tax=Arundo donax TaxID=35708 RepID=A0A0A8Y0T4_ARUDO